MTLKLICVCSVSFILYVTFCTGEESIQKQVENGHMQVVVGLVQEMIKEMRDDMDTQLTAAKVERLKTQNEIKEMRHKMENQDSVIKRQSAVIEAFNTKIKDTHRSIETLKDDVAHQIIEVKEELEKETQGIQVKTKSELLQLIENLRGEVTRETKGIHVKISSVMSTAADLTKQIEKLVISEKDAKDGRKTLNDKIDTINYTLAGKIRVLHQDIARLHGEPTKEMARMKSKINSVEEYLEQLKMYVQLQQPKFKEKILLTYPDIVKLVGMNDKVTPANPILQKLIDLMSSFKKVYRSKWGITYADVLRLLDPSDFKDRIVLKKIDALFTLFTTEFKRKWGISFKDVINLMKKSDMKDVPVKDTVYGYATVPLVLRKIEHLFTVFVTTYNPIWHIRFPDVISLTKDLDFAEDAKEIPVLTMISGWHIDNFEEIWGVNFRTLFYLLIKMDDTSRADTLKFLPATIASTGNNGISILGYVEILLNKAWGTIWNRKNETVPFTDNNAATVCHHGGYSYGHYDNCAYCKGTVDRTNMTCLLSKLQCFGTESSPLECPTKVFDTNVTWSHDEDVAIKCIL